MATASSAGPIVGSSAPVRATATLAMAPSEAIIHWTYSGSSRSAGRTNATSGTIATGQNEKNVPTIAESRPVAPYRPDHITNAPSPISNPSGIRRRKTSSANAAPNVSTQILGI